MIRKNIKRIVIGITLIGLIALLVVFQEYRPVNTDGLSIEHIRQADLVADFIYPSSKTSLPVVLFLGGSGGGLSYEEELKALAMNGYAVLSLAYFKAPGLPGKLENIPLEYFEHAFNWLKTKNQVDTAKLLLIGVSRGAELALLLGSTFSQVKGVIAYAPSCFVLPNATEVEKDTLIASWTLHDKPISFARIHRFEEQDHASIDYKKYLDPLLEQPNDTEDYLIKVERINGPILLISGEQDLVWPASEMARRIEIRLKKHDFRYDFDNVIFENGAHDLLMFKNCLPIASSIAFRKFNLNIRGRKYQFNLGGTALGVIGSKVRSRTLALQYLERFKNSQTP
jgi:dienelactone hydrolase